MKVYIQVQCLYFSSVNRLFPNGHLFDLQNDPTNLKFAEMEFMQSIVNGNRLIYENSKLGIIKQSPCDAFGTIGKIGDFSWLENVDFLFHCEN